MSGRYAHNHGVLSNGGGEEPGQRALDHDTTMQAYLQGDGYLTGVVGKLFNGWPLRKVPPYWDHFAINRGGYRDIMWNINGTVEPISTYSTRFVGDQASGFIEDSERRDEQPWMLYLSPYAPHRPWKVQKKYADSPVNRWEGNPAVQEHDLADKPPWLRSGTCAIKCGRRVRAGQSRLLRSVDDLVLKLREKLAEFDEANTLVIYISDNGYLWGEHGMDAKAQPYVQSSRVPLMMRWPRHVEPGTVDKRFALNIDIAPTILAAAGVAVGETPMDGRSLLIDSARNRVLLEHWCSNGQQKSLSGCDRWASTRTHDYQYIERYDAEGEVIFREYYDNATDPWQLSNLLKGGDPKDRTNLRALASQLLADRSCVGGLCP